MECYEKFKSRIAVLCERGKISKDAKKRLSVKAELLSDAVYAVANALYPYFTECKMNDEGFVAVCDAATDLFTCFADTFPAFALEAAVVGAYAKVMREFNESGDARKGKILKERYEQYIMAAENIKRQVRMFDLKQ